jgi:hypothetical protein
MPTKYCEVCSLNVVNLNRHIKSKKHKRFQEWLDYGNYGDQEWQDHNNNIRKGLKDKGRIPFLTYLYSFFAYILTLMCFKRVQG